MLWQQAHLGTKRSHPRRSSLPLCDELPPQVLCVCHISCATTQLVMEAFGHCAHEHSEEVEGGGAVCVRVACRRSASTLSAGQTASRDSAGGARGSTLCSQRRHANKNVHKRVPLPQTCPRRIEVARTFQFGAHTFAHKVGGECVCVVASTEVPIVTSPRLGELGHRGQWMVANAASCSPSKRITMPATKCQHASVEH